MNVVRDKNRNRISPIAMRILRVMAQECMASGQVEQARVWFARIRSAKLLLESEPPTLSLIQTPTMTRNYMPDDIVGMEAFSVNDLSFH